MKFPSRLELRGLLEAGIFLAELPLLILDPSVFFPGAWVSFEIVAWILTPPRQPPRVFSAGVWHFPGLRYRGLPQRGQEIRTGA